MFIKSLLLVFAFGIAMTVGIASNTQDVDTENAEAIENPDVTSGKKNIVFKQENAAADQNSKFTQKKSRIQNPAQNTIPTTEPQKGARMNSVHFGLSHAEMQSKEACTACHQSSSDHVNQYSPYFLGFFSNSDNKGKSEVDVAFLGVNASDVPSAVRSHLQLDENNGAIVNNVVEESPAYHCGIEKHDVLVAIDHQPVNGEKSLLKLIRSHSPGSKIVVEYVRAGKKESINLVLGKQKTARILRSFQINGCEAQLTSATNCQSCHAAESK